MPDLDDAALDAIEARANAATDGPWSWDTEAEILSGNGARVMFAMAQYADDCWLDVGDADAAFIAAARTDVTALVTALRAEREESRRWKRAFGNAEAEAKHARAEHAAAIARAEAAEAAIAAVRALHTPRLIEYTHTANGPEDAVYECRKCQQPLTAAVWPCATRRALDTGATP